MQIFLQLIMTHGASKTNQINRIKLLLTVAKDNLKNKNNVKKAIEIENLIQEENLENKQKIN